MKKNFNLKDRFVDWNTKCMLWYMKDFKRIIATFIALCITDVVILIESIKFVSTIWKSHINN